MTVAGLLLAAGAGRRMGAAKALLRDGSGVLFVDRALRVLLDGGCTTVTVVLGAAAEDVCASSEVVDDDRVSVTQAGDWADGMGASLRAGLAALGTGPQAALVTLVDLPDVSAAVVARVLVVPATTRTLARATYDGVPGHPVLLGCEHWPGVVATALGDQGARDYLDSKPVRAALRLVECGDLAPGRDVDTPSDL